METAIDKQVSIINNSIELFKSAPEILKQNQDRTAKAMQVGADILTHWHKAWAIENEDDKLVALASIDERSNKFLANCSAALKGEKELRASITQMMDMFKKMFTDAENELDKAKAGTTPNKIQSFRDDYAKTVYEINERKRKEAEAVAAKAKDKIDLIAEAEKRFANHYQQLLLTDKNKLQETFNKITLENYDKACEWFKNNTPALEIPRLQFNPSLISRYFSSEEIISFVDQIVADKSEECSNNYAAELGLLNNELLDKLPSKKAELEEQKRLADEAEVARKAAAEAKNKEDKERAEAAAKAAEDAKQKAAEEQRKREEEDAARIKKEAEDAAEKAAQDAEIKAQGEHTMAMFDQEAALAENTVAPEARQGYEIAVLHQAGYVQIFQLWFENEGKNLPIDKIGNTKLDQMKAWAEKHAHKTGTKIESKFLKYNESFKAVNRKAK